VRTEVEAPLINNELGQNAKNLKRSLDEESIFLDAHGNNFSELQKALTKATELMKLWWKGEADLVPPRPTEDEVERLVAILEEEVGHLPFSNAYRELVPCIKSLFAGVRFNKFNLMNVHPSPFLPSLVASFVTMLQNPNNLSPSTSPATTSMEEECLAGIANLIGFSARAGSPRYGGNVVSCGTISNLTALLVAREKAYKTLGGSWVSSIRISGLFEAPKGVIVTSKSAHYSIAKSARILGLGEDGVVEVPVVGERELADFELSGTPLRLKPSIEAYAETLENIERSTNKGSGSLRIVSAVTTLGTISTGTIEEIQPLIHLRERFGFHLHIDAAIGGLALALDEVRKKSQGVDLADSITVDPHKLGFVPYPCSVILFREESDLELIAMDAPYVDSSASTIEGSRPGSSVAAFWVALKTLGTSGYGRIIGKCIDLTRYLGKLLQGNGYQVLHEIDLNTICFSLRKEGLSQNKTNRLVNELYNRIVADGRYLVSKVEDIPGVRVRDKPWQKDSEKTNLTAIKVWIMNPQMNEKDIESLVHVLDEKRKELGL
jgi:glutamate/tyrosine decarboxylase-like PLP-dependent enzyme